MKHENKTAADKGQLIRAIRELNPTATEEFLRRFDARELRDYLRNLESTGIRESTRNRPPGAAENIDPMRKAS